MDKVCTKPSQFISLFLPVFPFKLGMQSYSAVLKKKLFTLYMQFSYNDMEKVHWYKHVYMFNIHLFMFYFHPKLYLLLHYARHFLFL